MKSLLDRLIAGAAEGALKEADKMVKRFKRDLEKAAGEAVDDIMKCGICGATLKPNVTCDHKSKPIDVEFEE